MASTPRELVKINARIPAEYQHGMLKAVQSIETPFTTTTDVLRYCIERGLENITEAYHDPELQAAVVAVQTQRDIQQLDRYLKAEHAVGSFKATLRDAVRSGDEKWIGDTREACARFVATTPFRTLAERLQQEL